MSKELFEISCLKCGESVFAFPLIANAEYVFECRHCGQNTYVLINPDLGAIAKSEKQVADAYSRFENDFDPEVSLAELYERGCFLGDIRIRRTGAYAEVWWHCKGGWYWRNRPLVATILMLIILAWILWIVLAAMRESPLAAGSALAPAVGVGMFVGGPAILHLVWLIWWSTSSRVREEKKHHLDHSGRKVFNLLKYQ